MKGQVFLLTAGIIVAVLVALRGFATVQQISSEREILDVSLEDLAFRNAENEVKRLMTSLTSTPRNISDFSIDFLNFTRRGSSGHSLDMRALFVGVLANSTNQTMNITVFQFLRETNLNVTIRLNTSAIQTNSTLLNDSGVWVSNFTFTAGDAYNLTMILYNLTKSSEKDYEENITFKTRGGKDVYMGFFDLRLLSERGEHRREFYQTVKVS